MINIPCKNQKEGWGDEATGEKVHIQGMELLLADKVHKQEPQC